MTQTLAIFYEAYCNLNSKKMFWIVLVLSVLSVAAFACVGINEQGLKLLFWQIDTPGFTSQTIAPSTFYKMLFVNLGIGVWLTWIATILALISTSGIFPDLMTGGAIEMYVSKPISRLRLFVTEYIGGLLFVTLQVTLFTLASFLLIGLRGGAWEPGLFVAVPVTVCFFSYLFGVCVFLGVLTRSTVAAVLLTILFWLGLWMVSGAESTLLAFKTMREHDVDFAAMQAEQRERADGHTGAPAADGPVKTDDPDAAEVPSRQGGDALDVAYQATHVVMTVLPKTGETIALLQRWLFDLAELPQPPAEPMGPQQQRMRSAQEDIAAKLRGRSVAWIIGTSLGFEFVLVSAAAYLFCRRDY